MAKLTREEVIDRVSKGESLAGEDLSELDLRRAKLIGANINGANLREAYFIGADLSKANLSGAKLIGANLREADLSGANLSKANLSKANLSRADLFWANLSEAHLFGVDLSGAYLSRANLRECILNSANLGDANLSGADLTEANIYNIATTNWKIDGVKCEYVYNCKDFGNKEEREKTRRNFAPGEFEQIYKSFPKLELIFKEGFSHLDHRVLLAVVEHSNEEFPTANNLKVRKMEKIGDTAIVTLTAETNEDIEKAANELLPKYYAETRDKLAEIKKLLTPQNPSSFPLPVEFIQLPEIIRKLLDRLDKFKLPEEVIVNNQSRPFIVKLKEFGKGIGEGITSHTIFKALEELFKHFIGIG